MRNDAVSNMSDQELENILQSVAAERARRTEAKAGTDAVVAKVGALAEYLNTTTGRAWALRVLLDPQDGDPRALLQSGPWQIELRLAPTDRRAFVVLTLSVPKTTTKARQLFGDWTVEAHAEFLARFDSTRAGMLGTTKGVIAAQLTEVQELIDDLGVTL